MFSPNYSLTIGAISVSGEGRSFAPSIWGRRCGGEDSAGGETSVAGGGLPGEGCEIPAQADAFFGVDKARKITRDAALVASDLGLHRLALEDVHSAFPQGVFIQLVIRGPDFVGEAVVVKGHRVPDAAADTGPWGVVGLLQRNRKRKVRLARLAVGIGDDAIGCADLNDLLAGGAGEDLAARRALGEGGEGEKGKDQG